MTEQVPEYKTETDEAMEMLGVGYDEKQPSVIIQPKRKSVALMDAGLVEYDVWGWVKVSANFINHIQKLNGANLKCWLVIALAIDETGKCKLTIKQLQLLTKLSHTEVISSTKELEEMGYLGVKRNARGNEYEPLFVARGIGNEPVVKKVESTLVDQVESTPSIGKSHSSIKELKELSGNSSNPKDKMDVLLEFEKLAQRLKNAQIEFEAQLGFNPAWSKPDWEKQNRKIADLLDKDPNILKDFALWRKGDGKYQGLTNASMAKTATFFMDVAYPTFLASVAMRENQNRNKEKPL